MKIKALKKAYKFASIKTNQYFYIALLTANKGKKYWNIVKYSIGQKKQYYITRADELKKIIENYDK